MRYSIRFTENFVANLESIRSFLGAHEAQATFETLTDRLFDDIVPNLGLFPRMGRDFLERTPQSEEGKARLAELKSHAGEGAEIREYIVDDYLILYAIIKSTVSMLAIRHHRQLSFDLAGHWA